MLKRIFVFLSVFVVTFGQSNPFGNLGSLFGGSGASNLFGSGGGNAIGSGSQGLQGFSQIFGGGNPLGGSGGGNPFGSLGGSNPLGGSGGGNPLGSLGGSNPFGSLLGGSSGLSGTGNGFINTVGPVTNPPTFSTTFYTTPTTTSFTNTGTTNPILGTTTTLDCSGFEIDSRCPTPAPTTPGTTISNLGSGFGGFSNIFGGNSGFNPSSLFGGSGSSSSFGGSNSGGFGAFQNLFGGGSSGGSSSGLNPSNIFGSLFSGRKRRSTRLQELLKIK